MKTLKNISIIGALLSLTLLALPTQAQDMSGVMMVVKGDVKVTGKDGKTDAAKVGRKVSSGDMITSGADSRAKIVMADKNVINVSPDSKILIEKYENDGKDKKNVELNVMYGKVRASVEQKYDGEKSKFNIKTPSAVAGVRGTDFMAGYSAKTKTTQVITFSGTVAVGKAGPGGTLQNVVYVQPGQMTQVGSGQAPEAPKAVPKEELNNANKESKAETASPSSSQKDPAADSSAEPKKEEAKKEEAKKDEPKKDDVKKDEPKKEEVKKDDIKKDEPKKEEPKKEAATDKQAPKERGPASEGSSSGSNSSGGSTSAAPAPAPAAAPTAPPVAMTPDLPGQPNAAPMPSVPLVPVVPPTPPKAYVPPLPPTDIIKSTQKTRLSITIQAP